MKTAESVCARGGTVWKAAAGIRTSEGEEYERAEPQRRRMDA